MKTRRKSKAAGAEEQEHDEKSSQIIEETSSNAPLTVAIPADVDVDSLSNIVPDASLTSVSPETVVLIYKVLLAQSLQNDAAQRELDEARAEAEKKDVELDQALQDREGLSKELETSLETVQAE